jgi:DNA-binding response OmpR family regulator
MENYDSYKILIVDDDVDIVETMAFALQKSFSVITASNGADGLIKAKYEEPDVIILDLMMPKMDGFEVCLKLKSDDVTKKIPVIIFTARNDKDAHYKVFKCGNDDYIVKPFRLTDLVTKINKALLAVGKDGSEKKTKRFDSWL